MFVRLVRHVDHIRLRAGRGLVAAVMDDFGRNSDPKWNRTMVFHFSSDLDTGATEAEDAGT